MGAAVPELSEHRDGPQCRACKLYGRELRTRGDDKSCDAIPVEIRVGHGLGPSMGWVGLGRVGSEFFFNFWWVGLGWVET